MIATADSQRLHEVAAVLATLDESTREEVLACFSSDERERLWASMDAHIQADGEPTGALVMQLLHALRWRGTDPIRADAEGTELAHLAMDELHGTGERAGVHHASAVPSDPLEAFLTKIPVRELVDLLEAQHPQIAAAMLRLLPRDQAERALQGMDVAIQSDLTDRMARCEELHPEIARELRCELMNRFTPLDAATHRIAGGSERSR